MKLTNNLTNNLLNNQNYILWKRENSKVLTYFLWKSLLWQYKSIATNSLSVLWIILWGIFIVWEIYFFLFLHTDNLLQWLYMIILSLLLYFALIKVSINHSKKIKNLSKVDIHIWKNNQYSVNFLLLFKDNSPQSAIRSIINALFIIIGVSIGLFYIATDYYNSAFMLLVPILIVWISLLLFYMWKDYLSRISILFIFSLLVLSPLMLLISIVLLIFSRFSNIIKFFIIKKSIKKDSWKVYTFQLFQNYEDQNYFVYKK